MTVLPGDAWPYLTLALLGTFHGLNPAMGWLFAVGLGLQEKRLGAVFKALPPIALGHLAAVLVTVLLVGTLQIFIAPDVLRYLCAVALILFGLYKLIWRRHPRWVGMRVGFADLVLWSFLMASAHGAGLMLLPIQLLGARAENLTTISVSSPHAHHLNASPDAAEAALGSALLAVSVHTLAMYAVMTLIAVVVYQKVGLTILRRAWFNLDFIWVGALIAAGVVMLAI